MFSTTETASTSSTTRICFVCNTNVNLSSKTFDSVLENFELCHRYLVLASRYLNLNIKSSNNANNLFKPELSLNTKSDNWTWHLKPKPKNGENCCCCDGCVPILKAFCKMYGKWTRLNLRLYGNAQTVASLLEKNQKQVFGDPGPVEKFKGEFASKVQKVPTHDFPRLRLPKMNTSNKIKMTPKENIVIPQQEVEVAHTNTGKKWICNTCGKRFAQYSGLYQHRVIHKEGKRYSCPFCERKFHYKQSLTTHKRIHTGEKPYMCGVPDCRKRFSQLGSFRYHQRVHHQIYRDGPIIKHFRNKQAINENSNEMCSLDDILENALRNEAPPLIANNGNSNVVDDKVQENLIDFEDDNSVVIISPTKPQKFASKQILQNDMPQREVQNQKPTEPTEKLPISMINSGGHNRKIPITENDNLNWGVEKSCKSWVCNTCSKQFSSQQSLSQHRQIHSGVKRFSCIFCERKFHQKSSLVNHMRIHTMEQPYVCGIQNCQKSFKQQSLCKYHQRRKHNANECGPSGAVKDSKKSQAHRNNKDINSDDNTVPRNLLATSFSKTTEKSESRPESEIGKPDTIKYDGTNASVKIQVDEDDDVVFIPQPIKCEVPANPREPQDKIPGSGVSSNKFHLNCLEQELDLLD